MSLAMVGDRKGIQLQNLCTNYPSWHVLLLHFSSFTAVPYAVSEEHKVGGMVLNRMYGKGEKEGNEVTEVC